MYAIRSYYDKAELEKGFLGMWKIEESSDEISSRLELSEYDNARVTSFKLESRKKEYLASRLLIKELLEIQPIIKYFPSGKPFLANSDYQISISHTKGFAAVVISEKNKAGIDIEIPSKRVTKISSRFISNEEDKFIPDDKKIEYYTLMSYNFV